MLTYSDFLLRVVLPMGLGAAINVECQWRQRLAGLPTNTLVSMGSAIFIALPFRFAQSQDPSPLRVVAQIISGIGFLGAGVIMKEGRHVRGLHTAATLWCSAAVGSLWGMGYGAEALTSAAAVVLVHLVLRSVGITADITSVGWQGQVMEKIVSLLSLEQLVPMVRWKVLAQSTK